MTKHNCGNLDNIVDDNIVDDNIVDDNIVDGHHQNYIRAGSMIPLSPWQPSRRSSPGAC